MPTANSHAGATIPTNFLKGRSMGKEKGYIKRKKRFAFFISIAFYEEQSFYLLFYYFYHSNFIIRLIQKMSKLLFYTENNLLPRRIAVDIVFVR